PPLARIVAHVTGAEFEELSAVSATVAQVREVLARARERLGSTGRRTILFLDEIHRFNKAQQDALLPAVEEGTVVLIGATTENPYFEVNSALISRTRIYELRALTADHVAILLRRALERGEGGDVTVADDVVEFLAARAGAAGRRRRGPGGRALGDAGGALRARAGRRLPRAGAQVRRLRPRAARGARPRPRARRAGPAGRAALRRLPRLAGARPRRRLR